MSSVGYEMLMEDPPVKNGFTNCRSGDIMPIPQTSSANAEGEVRRSFVGNYPPLYQLAYLTGGRQFYALHKELVDSGKMTNKEFHDRIITMNAMPVEIIKAIMTDQKISKNYKAKWKFYEAPKQ